MSDKKCKKEAKKYTVITESDVKEPDADQQICAIEYKDHYKEDGVKTKVAEVSWNPHLIHHFKDKS